MVRTAVTLTAMASAAVASVTMTSAAVAGAAAASVAVAGAAVASATMASAMVVRAAVADVGHGCRNNGGRIPYSTCSAHSPHVSFAERQHRSHLTEPLNRGF